MFVIDGSKQLLIMVLACACRFWHVLVSSCLTAAAMLSALVFICRIHLHTCLHVQCSMLAIDELTNKVVGVEDGHI